MNITSRKSTIGTSQEEVFNYLTNLDNLQYLLPKGKYSDWQGSEDKCSFKIQGFKIPLEKVETIPNEKIKMKTADGSPVDFDLNIELSDNGDGTTTGQVISDLRVNMFLKGMIKKPLTALFEYMAERLEKVEY